ncbi:hypothetical protein [Nocardioides sp. SR21]|uniref:hypothetical protein n=1 Tax=Nocardioides sp. SR21 TaxID=2919501 RepID=UPI001FA9A93C|nr:hypothetical protein [Nocardioides sp. SR21]
MRTSRSVGRALSVFTLVATAAVATAGWAAPVDPVPVKDDPAVIERAPATNGAWFGWARVTGSEPERSNFYVQRGAGPRVKVNAPRTQGLSGGIVGRSAFYVQQLRDNHPRINRFDLGTGKRSALPKKVNHRLDYRVRGSLSVSGPWLLYNGTKLRGQFGYPYHTVVLYNRVTHKLRTLASASSDWYDAYAGQVNGRYATYLWEYLDDTGTTSLNLYDIETKQSVELYNEDGWRQWVPAVSSDGTMYYFRWQQGCPSPCTRELVRLPIGGTPEVVATLTTGGSPLVPYVEDRPDGNKVVYFTWNDDLYQVVDEPQG